MRLTPGGRLGRQPHHLSHGERQRANASRQPIDGGPARLVLSDPEEQRILNPSMPLRAGDAVQTPFGKGTVREVRKNGVLVDVRGRALVFPASAVSPLGERWQRGRAHERSSGEEVPAGGGSDGGRGGAATEVDLHGFTVAQALERAERSLNEALLADVPELRFIHGRGGGRIRAALHRWLRGISSVRAFRIDPGNQGVTIVHL